MLSLHHSFNLLVFIHSNLSHPLLPILKHPPLLSQEDCDTDFWKTPNDSWVVAWDWQHRALLQQSKEGLYLPCSNSAVTPLCKQDLSFLLHWQFSTLPTQLWYSRTGPEKLVFWGFRTGHFVLSVSFASNSFTSYTTSIYNFGKVQNNNTDITKLAETASKLLLVCWNLLCWNNQILILPCFCWTRLQATLEDLYYSTE